MCRLLSSVVLFFVAVVGTHVCNRRHKLCSLLIFLCGYLLGLYSPFSYFPTEDISLNYTTELTRRHPFIFIGGHPRSGTTLMRVLLDVHPWIRCGPETRVVPMLMNMYSSFSKPLEQTRLKAAGIYTDTLDAATAAFIMEVLKRAGPPARRICEKDPMILKQLPHLARMFPNAKFIHMVRDGRAVIASIKKRNVSISNYNIEMPYMALTKWERLVSNFLQNCEALGRFRCMSIRYEELVLQPRTQLRKIFTFLDVPWDPIVLHHETVIEHESRLSRHEKSTTQVIHPIHLESLASWASNDSVLPTEFIYNAHHASSLLKKLGYASIGFPPNYGEPEPEVLQRSAALRNDRAFRNVFLNSNP